MKVGIVGLGKLGLPCAEVLARSHDVVGFDINPHITSSSPLRISKDLSDAVINQDLILVAVPTPHDPAYDGRAPVSHLPLKDFSYDAVQKTLSAIHRLAPRSVVVLISTVLPGTVRKELAPLLPEGELIYNPYFIAMGTVKEDFLNPEMLPIGTEDGSERYIGKLLQLYQSILKEPPVVVGTWEEAECIKIFYNTFISFKLSFVNMIQDVSQRIGHCNTDVVTHALTRAHQRILSPMYMKAGMGDGGPCHPRDNIALRDLAQKLNLGYDLFGAIIQSREAQAQNLARYLTTFQRSVCIMGVGFKPECPLVDGSYSLLVAHYLQELQTEVSFYDPLAGFAKRPTKAQVYLLAHPYNFWNEDFQFPEGSLIVDPWRTAPSVQGCTVQRYGDTR